MRAYQKGDRLYFVHKATLTCEFIGCRIDPEKPIGLFPKLPTGCKREGWHRVVIEVVKTKKEMAKMEAARRRRFKDFKTKWGIKPATRSVKTKKTEKK